MSSFTMGNMFEGMRLLSALNLKDDIQGLILAQSKGETKMTQEEFGFSLLLEIFESASKKNAEAQIYSFLSKLLNTEINEESNPAEVIELLTTFADVEEWKSFFTSVWRLIIRN
jgi:hypothetical protein